MKFATKFIRYYPPHLRGVATLPWEIKHLNFLQIFSRYGKNANKLHFNSSNFASCSLNWLQINFHNSLLFYLFTFAINLCHRKFFTADVTAMTLNNQHGMKRHEQDFDKTFIWNQYEERLAILNTKNVKIFGWTTKLEATKMQFICIFFHSYWIYAENLNF